MEEYYIDIETYGKGEIGALYPNLHGSKVILIGLLKDGEFEFLKEWEHDEKAILQKFMRKVLVFKHKEVCEYRFIGYNILRFDMPFLQRRILELIDRSINLTYDLNIVDIFQWRYIFNGHEFMNEFGFKKEYVSLNDWMKIIGRRNLLSQKRENKLIPLWYEQGKYSKIIEHCKKDLKQTEALYTFFKNKYSPLSLLKQDLHFFNF
ncbi:MAG: ribonuclease H-like domain-containing protein [Euryarchaeota archaeon]|nr:ribonuclease H-like domain-containing protein [Euryarchaeota archaeon]